jgi:hypothetical protein
VSAYLAGLAFGRDELLYALIDAQGVPTFGAANLEPIAKLPIPPGTPLSIVISPHARSLRSQEATGPVRSTAGVDVQERLAETLRTLSPNCPVRCVTTAADAVRVVFGECAFVAGHERIEVWRGERDMLESRSSPCDAPDDPGTLVANGTSVPIRFATAFAAAKCDPDRVPNRAALLPGARGALLARLREPLVNLAAAAALLLAAVGVWCHREKAREDADLAQVRGASVELWNRLLPGETPKEGALLKALLAQSGQADEPTSPSALAFWIEIGRHLPDPEPIGLNVDALDITPEGGRLSARVPAAKEDPLKNASVVEGQLNQSQKLRARGDYEVRDGQVQIRLRMEFRP